MHKGKLVFAQLGEHLPQSVFAQCVSRYSGKYAPLQVLALGSVAVHDVRPIDVARELARHQPRVCAVSAPSSITRAFAAASRAPRWPMPTSVATAASFEDFALHLIGIARPLYASDSLAVQLEQTVYAIDASTIDLCLSLFAWAPAANATRRREAAHLAGLARQHSDLRSHHRRTAYRMRASWTICALEAGSFYVMDRGYLHFARLIRFTHAAAFFVIRSKDKLHYRSRPLRRDRRAISILRDEHIVMTRQVHPRALSAALRRIEFHDAERNRRSHLPDQPLRAARPCRSPAVQEPLASRTVLQMDQAEPAHQGISSATAPTR